LDIQEKKPFTDNRMNEFASSGTYYFSSANLMLNAFEYVRKNDLQVGGEYYVSLAYKFLISIGLKTHVYPIQHFMQWGTPDDFEEYKSWSEIFESLTKDLDVIETTNGINIIPMAGLGERFSKAGYKTTKPLIPVSGKSMVIQAANYLPRSNNYTFILREDMPDHESIIAELQNEYKEPNFVSLSGLTDGQACSAKFGIDLIRKESSNIGPITIGACDNGMIYDINKFQELIIDPDIDIIVWGFRGHPNAIRKPEMYGWIDSNHNNDIFKISVKKPLRSVKEDPIVIGTFTFKNIDFFDRSFNSLINRKGKINGEYYLDALINDAILLNLKCKLFIVDHFISWGTPNDLKTFQYWQSCFHKWKSHSYDLDKDYMVSKESIPELKNRYKALYKHE